MKALWMLIALFLPTLAMAQPPTARDAESKQIFSRYGPEGLAALERQPPEVVAKLKSFIQGGQIDYLPSPRRALAVCAQYGPVVTEALIERQEALRTPTDFEAFCDNPVPFAYGGKTFADAANERKAVEKKAPPVQSNDWVPKPEMPTFVAGFVGLLFGMFLGAFARKRKAQA